MDSFSVLSIAILTWPCITFETTHRAF